MFIALFIWFTLGSFAGLLRMRRLGDAAVTLCPVPCSSSTGARFDGR